MRPLICVPVRTALCIGALLLQFASQEAARATTTTPSSTATGPTPTLAQRAAVGRSGFEPTTIADLLRAVSAALLGCDAAGLLPDG